jgi:tRNA(fMet)-specific endonuclease VapC
MPRFIFDTDHLTLYQRGHSAVRRRYSLHSPTDVGISAVTVEEALRGRLSYLARPLRGPSHVQAYAGLVATVLLLQQFPVVPFDQASETQFQQLQAMGLRVGTQDLKIAAVVLANKATLLTCNRRDFARIPGISLDDWSV